MRSQFKRALSMLLVLGMVLGMLPAVAASDAGEAFTDVEGHWAEQAIETWSEHGVMKGYDGNFRPRDSITRAEMAQVVANLLQLTDRAENTFRDVAEDAWYADAVLQCAAAGIMVGSDGLFRPGDPISRQESMVVVARALAIKPVEAPAVEAFADGEQVADWAKGAVAALMEAKIVEGTSEGLLAPLKDVSRAEIVTILDRAVSTYIAKPGTYTLEEDGGAGIVLVVSGGVTVGGTAAGTVLVGGGAAQGSVELKDLKADSVVVAAGGVQIEVAGKSDIKTLEVQESAEQVKVEVGKDATVEDIQAPAGTQVVEPKPQPSTGGSSGGDSRPSVTIQALDNWSMLPQERRSTNVVTTPADAELTVSSSDSSIVTAELKDRTLHIRALGAGTATVTVTASADGYRTGERQMTVTVQAAVPAHFPVFAENVATPLYVSPADHKQVVRAAGDLKLDVERVTGTQPGILNDTADLSGSVIIIGSVDESDTIKALMEAGKLDEAKELEGQWESYLLKVVDAPMEGVDRALVIAGSDARGTVYGIYDLSEQIGVSPWYYWGDIAPQIQTEIHIEAPLKMEGEPSVKYRGIFINDEQNLAYWAAVTEEKAEGTAWKDGNITPDTYAKVYELLLRLRSNYLWTAMHSEPRLGPDASGANNLGAIDHFNKYPENRRLADEYGIIVGTSHCEPMMRNNTAEWGEFLQKDKGLLQGVDLSKITEKVQNWMKRESPVQYNYSIEKDRPVINEYWDKSVEAYKDYEVSYTLGMRGIHDEGFLTPENYNQTQKRELLQQVVNAQIKMMEDNDVNKDAFPIFIPYKEVLPLYENGLELPEETIIVWAEDNHGYIRRFPTEEENEKYAGSGVYYHINYEGGGSYSWLTGVSPSLMVSEMNKAYDSGAQALWVLNVGDIKPGEISMDLFLEMAWDIDRWNGGNLEGNDHEEGYYELLAEKWFPAVTDSEEVAALINGYFEQVAILKADHTTGETGSDRIGFSMVNNGDELMQRVATLQDLAERAQAIYDGLYDSDRAQADAFYQHVAYPIVGTYYNNLKYYHSQKNALCLSQGRLAAANLHAELVDWAHEQEDAATDYYNTGMSGGKWNFIMQPHNSENLRPDRSPKPSANTVDSIPYMSALGVVAEGEQTVTDNSVLNFSAYLEDTHFIDLFNMGTKSFAYTVAADPNWVKVSEASGTVYDELRLFVDIDWENLPAGDQTATLTVSGAGESKEIQIQVNNPAKPREKISGYAEANGYVAMEAEHFTTNEKKGDIGFSVFEGLGRSGDAVSAGPMGSASYAGDVSSAPYLTYDVTFQTAGNFPTTIYRIPTLETSGQRFAIGVDDGAPVVIRSQHLADEGSWRKNVVNGIEKLTTTLKIPSAGTHTIKLYMVDAGVAIDRIVINTGGEGDSNLGPRESYHSVYNTDPAWTPALVSMEQSYLKSYMETLEAGLEGMETDAAQLLRAELTAVEESLNDIQDDTVRRGYARLAAAVYELETMKDIDTLIPAALQKGQALLDNSVSAGGIALYQPEVVTAFRTEFAKLKTALEGTGLSAAEKMEQYGALASAIHRVESARMVFATASSEEGNKGNRVGHLIDGDPATRWAASSSDFPQWVVVDLGRVYSLDEISVTWFNNSSNKRAYQYNVQVSQDGMIYTTVVDRANNTQQDTVTDNMKNVLGRYVKINVTDSEAGSASIHEIVLKGEWLEPATLEQRQALAAAVADAKEALPADNSLYTVDSYAALVRAIAISEALAGSDEALGRQTEQAILDMTAAVEGLAGRSYIVQDTFNKVGDLSAMEGWKLVEDGGNITLVDENGNKYLKLEQTQKGKDDAKSVEARRSFTETSGKVYVEAKVRSDTPQTFYGAPYLYQNNNSNTILGALALRDNGQIMTTYQTNNSSAMTQVGAFEAGEWNTISLVLDSGTQTMQAYVNGELAKADLPMRNTLTALGMLRFYSDDKTGDRPLAVAYVDDVFVYQEGAAPGNAATEAERQALESAVNEAQAVEAEPYTIDSYTELKTLVKAAQTLLENESASSKAVVAMTEDLQAAYQALKEKKIISKDIFDNLESIDKLDSSWKLTQTGGTVTLETDGTNKYLKLEQTQPEVGTRGTVAAAKSFDELSGKVYIEAKVATKTPQYFFGAPYVFQNDTNGFGGGESIVSAQLRAQDINHAATDIVINHSDKKNDTIGQFASEEWYVITMVLDTRDKSILVYLDGEQAVGTFSFRAQKDAIGLLYFYADDNKADRPATTGYVDDVIIYTEKSDVNPAMETLDQQNEIVPEETEPGEVTSLLVDGAPVEGFAAETVEYRVAVPADCEAVTVDALTTAPGCTVLVNGGGEKTLAFALDQQTMMAEIEVIFPDGTAAAYTVILERTVETPADSAELPPSEEQGTEIPEEEPQASAENEADM